MFSETGKEQRGTAAWRISLWGSIAFALGTAVVFCFLQHFLATEIQDRADSWLSGELGVLADIAERTSPSHLHDTIIREVAELASREVPRDGAGASALNQSVFFLQLSRDGAVQIYTGAGSDKEVASRVFRSDVTPERPTDLRIQGMADPFRVAEATLQSGDHIYLALSRQHQRKVLRRLRIDFAVIWFAIIVLGSSILYLTTRRMLRRIQAITETTETIGRNNLSSRVPLAGTNDEISRLSVTLNRMLDRVETSVQQLHAMSDALAHDLRSPMTSLRGKLELAQLRDEHGVRDSAIGQCIEEVDRLSSLLNTSLDVTEASADALRIRKECFNLSETLQTLVELYEPVFAHAGLRLYVNNVETIQIMADQALVQRLLSNLLDNELKHLRNGRTASITLSQDDASALLRFEDDGEGFPPDLLPYIFNRYVKGPTSSGFGLGLALVSAVTRSHDGFASASNKPGSGACIEVSLPLVSRTESTGKRQAGGWASRKLARTR